jgi:hypothetical protein
MSVQRVCDLSCGAMHEFALVLDKAGFTADLVKKIVNSRANKLAKTMLGSLVEKTEKATSVAEAIVGNPDTSFMSQVYEKLFGKVPDFSELVIPRAPDARQYIAVPVMRELVDWTDGSPKEGLFQARKKLFPCWKYTEESLDIAIPSDKDERNPANGSYVVLMLDSETPDEDLMNKSANQIAEMDEKTSTHLEYALFSTMYFLKHGRHPDTKTCTLNAGSRCRDGGVPNGDWNDDGSYVYWGGAGNRNPDLGSRRVIL